MKRRTFLLGIAATPFGAAAESFAARAFSGVLSAEDCEALPTQTADVVVLGGGAGGLTAATSAAEAGAGRVLLFEKNPRLGGDTLISGGYFSAVLPERQSRYGIDDSIARFEAQILETGQHANDPAVVHRLASEAGNGLLWLEAHGMNFLPEPLEVFGSGWQRCFKPLMPRGQGYLRALTAAAYSSGVEIKTGAAARALVRSEAGTDGVVVREPSGAQILVRARRGIVIATGGFAANRKMLEHYAPRAAGLPVDSQPGSTGEITRAASAAGASLVNMASVECVPGSREGIDYPIRLDYIPSKMIMVDAGGRRFVEENASRSIIAAAILQYGDSPCWAIADADAVAAFDAVSQKNIYRGLYSGEAFRAPTAAALAGKLGIAPSALAETLAAPPANARIGKAPLWAVRMHLRVHATLGGIRINDAAQVLDESGRPLEGLWACGACTGSVHGKSRIGGNGINTAVVFGRLAGAAAAAAPRRA